MKSATVVSKLAWTRWRAERVDDDRDVVVNEASVSNEIKRGDFPVPESPIRDSSSPSADPFAGGELAHDGEVDIGVGVEVEYRA